MPDNNEQQSSRVAYGFLWLWFLIVSAAAICLYAELARLVAVATVISGLGWPSELATAVMASWLAWPLLILGGALFWWRTVKVVVLHGVPLRVTGFQTIPGNTAKNADTGRRTSSSWIGDNNAYGSNYQGQFWFGSILRAHSSSDKLMRSRLELLIIALPAGYSFFIHESQWFLRKHTHQDRAKLWRLWRDRYANTRPSVTEDSFRRDINRHLKTLANQAEKDSRRIDGLNWHVIEEECTIFDDFGHKISFSREGGQFKVRLRGPAGVQIEELDSLDAVRKLARDVLTPLP